MTARHWIIGIALLLAACGGGGGGTGMPGTTGGGGGGMPPAFVATPLNDLGNGTYLGQYHGGLYENGTNAPPSDHAAVGTARAAAVTPRDTNGSANANGKYVLLSIGMSNTTNLWCIGPPPHATPPPNPPSCFSYTFMGQAAADPSVNHTTLAIADGAYGGQTAMDWMSPADADYNRVRDTILAPAGLTEKQVEIVYLSDADADPTVALPSSNSDAYALETFYGDIARALKVRYPNLLMVFFGSRTYAGYANTTLNPEPYSYESGFSVKWIIQAQIDQMRNGGTVVDPRAGDLNYNTGAAPWLAWGAYTWADGTTPRSDGLTWLATDYYTDGTHESQAGIVKLVNLLLPFFKTSPFTKTWF
jgi:hypothetical protein